MPAMPTAGLLELMPPDGCRTGAPSGLAPRRATMAFCTTSALVTKQENRSTLLLRALSVASHLDGLCEYLTCRELIEREAKLSGLRHQLVETVYFVLWKSWNACGLRNWSS